MVYSIQQRDIDKASQVLGRAFSNYPIFKYILPDPQYRKNKIHHLFSFLIKIGLLNGEVIAPSKNIEGVGIWRQVIEILLIFINSLGSSKFMSIRCSISINIVCIENLIF